MDNQMNYANALCKTINALRKEKGFTQDSLAEKLGISFQAVSKWETGQSCPDITMLPLLADIFNVTVDALFAIERPVPDDVPVPNAPQPFADSSIDWADDGKLRAVVFQGRKRLMEPVEEAGKFTLELHGDVCDVEAYMNLVCGNVDGDIQANGSVLCGSVYGDVKANGTVTCGDVNGDVETDGDVICNTINGNVQVETVECEKIEGNVCADNAGGGSHASNMSNGFPDDGKLRAVVFRGNRRLTEPVEEAGKFTLELHGDVCDVEAYMNLVCGNVEGDVRAQGALQCGGVAGDVNANSGMQCGNVEGDVIANGGVHCGNVDGDIQANGSVQCGGVDGDVKANGTVICGDVEGNVTAKDGDVTCGSVEGNVHANTVKCDEIHGDVYAKTIE